MSSRTHSPVTMVTMTSRGPAGVTATDAVRHSTSVSEATVTSVPPESLQATWRTSQSGSSVVIERTNVDEDDVMIGDTGAVYPDVSTAAELLDSLPATRRTSQSESSVVIERTNVDEDDVMIGDNGPVYRDVSTAAELPDSLPAATSNQPADSDDVSSVYDEGEEAECDEVEDDDVIVISSSSLDDDNDSAQD